MPYPINQRAHQFNSIQSVPVSFGLWDTALKFLSPGPRNDVTDHLVMVNKAFCTRKQFLFRRKNVPKELPCKLIVAFLPKLAFYLIFNFFTIITNKIQTDYILLM